MSGFSVIPRVPGRTPSNETIRSWIDPEQILEFDIGQSNGEVFGVSYPGYRPSATARYHDDDRFVCMMVGDPVVDGDFEWTSVTQRLAEGADCSAEFRKLGGSFALAIADREAHQLTVVTDALGIQPVYVRETPDGPVVSTSYAAVAGYGDRAPAIDSAWVYEYLFFNYAVLDRTLFSGVKRLPACSVWTCDLRAGKTHSVPYDDYVAMEPLQSSQDDQVEEAVALFQAVVPDWFRSDAPVAMGLSGGLDSRAVLAGIPEEMLANVTTFTYGIQGSTEVTEARCIANAMGLDHREILLQDEFLERLPKLLIDTVFLSDGLQVINRSNLPLVYAAVAAGDRPAAAILTGVSGDHVFRDHINAWGNVPYLISADVAAMHRNGRRRIDRATYEQMFAGDFNQIESGLEHALDSLESEYGEFNQPESYYRYLMYVAGSRYFGGQAAIANRYSYFRTPYWDRRMVKFGIDSCLGTAGLSVGSDGKDLFLETVLQASVVASNARLAKVPYMGLPVSVFTKKNRVSYQAARVVRKIKSILLRKRRIKEEDWPLWYKTILAGEIDDLLGETSRIREYVRSDFISMKRAENDIHMLGKLITAEIALRLAENRWRK